MKKTTKMIKKFDNFKMNESIKLYGLDYLKSLNNLEINELVDELFSSDDLDDRMDICDQILSIIEDEYEKDYDRVEDSIKDLTIG